MALEDYVLGILCVCVVAKRRKQAWLVICVCAVLKWMSMVKQASRWRNNELLAEERVKAATSVGSRAPICSQLRNYTLVPPRGFDFQRRGKSPKALRALVIDA